MSDERILVELSEYHHTYCQKTGRQKTRLVWPAGAMPWIHQLCEVLVENSGESIWILEIDGKYVKY